MAGLELKFFEVKEVFKKVGLFYVVLGTLSVLVM